MVRREGKADGTYDIMMINEINNIFLLFEVANGELQDDQTYVVAVEAETSDGYSVVSEFSEEVSTCLLYTSPSPRDKRQSRMPSSA